MRVFSIVFFLCLIFCPIALGKKILLHPKETTWLEITSEDIYFRIDGNPKFSVVLVSQDTYEEYQNHTWSFEGLYHDDLFDRLCIDGVTSCHLHHSFDSKKTRHIGMMNIHSKRSGLYSYYLGKQSLHSLNHKKRTKSILISLGIVFGIVFGIIGIIVCCAACVNIYSLIYRRRQKKKSKRRKMAFTPSSNEEENQELLDVDVDSEQQ